MVRKKFAIRKGRQKRTAAGEFSYENLEDGLESVAVVEEPPLIECRCYLSNFTKHIRNWQMDDRRWALLRRTPFGSLIKDVQGLEIHMEILDALLGFWDEEHCGFFIGGIKIPFTVDDIALITGLPNRGHKVVWRRPGLKRDVEFSRIYLSIRNIRQKLNSILSNRIDSNPEIDKHFVQQMILYLWGSVLFPNASRTVPIYMSHYVKNLESIGSYNWAEALHSYLVKEINAKSKLVKERNEGKKVVLGCMNGLCLAISAWFFEHVDFGEDSRPSNPEARPRLLKWVEGYKFWQRKPFLQRLNEIVADKVTIHLLLKNDEFKLVSSHSEEHIPSQIGGFDVELGGEEMVGTEIKLEYQRTERRGRKPKQKEQETKARRGRKAVQKVQETNGSKVESRQKVRETKASKGESPSKVNAFTQVILKQNERISTLERMLFKIFTLMASKGWEIEGLNDIINREVDEQDAYDLTKILNKTTIDGDKGHMVEVADHPNLNSFARVEKKGCQQHGRRKILKSTTENKNLLLKRKRNFARKQATNTSINCSPRLKRKDTNILVNLDDYAGPSEQKKVAKVAPLNYVGRELLIEDLRKFLDAFCLKPMHRDDIVFFDQNISIRRHSMVEYLQGGYTIAEIIDAYALVLYEEAKLSENNFANFLYVPPMFLGLYRNKLGSYKTFLNSVDKKFIGRVKLIFLPCHISTANHWLLLVCDMKMRKWIGYDSLFDPRHRVVAKDQIMFLAEYLHQDHGVDIRSWSLDYRRIFPQQEPGTLDCGIFVMKFIESIIHSSRGISFKSTDVQLFRPQIAYKILLHA